MTVIFDSPGARTLSSYLRANGIYSVVRADLNAPELVVANTAVITDENASIIPKLKNTYENLRVIYLSTDAKTPPFYDTRVSAAEELLRAFPPVTPMIFAYGIVIDVRSRSLEKCGKAIALTPSEFDVLRCIATTAHPLSASLLSELALGEENPRCLMTHVSNVNRKSKETFGKKLIESDRAQGYSIIL